MVDINLLPKTYRRTGETSTWTYASVGLGLLTLLLIGIPELVMGGIIGGKQRQLDAQTAQIAQLNATVMPKFNELNTQKQQLGAIDQTVQALSATKTAYWSTDLANFVNNMPQQTDLNLLTINMTEPNVAAGQPIPQFNGQPLVRDFAITGIAASTGSVAHFLNAYEQNNYAVDLQATQRAQGQEGASGENPYGFTATVHRLGETAATTAPAGTPTADASAGAAPAAPGAAPAPAAPAATGDKK